jgi:predicted signal transduction protein with EAL and GGDEF domain
LIACAALAAVGSCLFGALAGSRDRKQEMRLQIAVNNMVQGLLILMFDKGEGIVIVNQRSRCTDCRQTFVKPGRTCRNLLQHRVAAGQLPQNAEQYWAKLISQLASGTKVAWLGETADGRRISIIDIPMPDGRWLVTHEDASEHWLAERKLEDAQRFLSTIIENAPVPIVVKEPMTQQLVLANRAYEQFVGLADQIRSAIAMPFDPDGDQVRVDVRIGIAVAQGAAISAEQLLQNADMALYGQG